MKKIILLFVGIIALVCSTSAQNSVLQKWTSGANKTIVSESKPNASTPTKKESDIPQRTSFFGVGFGYTSEGYIPVSIHYTHKKIYYGLSIAIPAQKGTKGEDYNAGVNWDEMSEDVKEEGTYYTPVTFDMGYDFKNFTLGAGVGIAVGTKYRNCFDEFHILGDNGNYYKTTSNGTTGEFKVFAKYRFPTKNPYPICRFYISAQYSIRTGIGATIGIDI